MPELPEVETIRRDLEAALLGQTVVGFEVFDSRLISPKEVARWSKLIVGQAWKSFHRKGKYLEVELANDWRLVVHLRMTGQLLLSPSSGLRPPSPALPREKAKPCPLPAEHGRGWRSPGEGSRLRLCFAHGNILRLVDQR